MILEYEIMKYDGDLGRPNFYVPLSEDICRDKITGICDAFPIPSQATMVRRADILVIATVARRRVQCSLAPCRSVFCQKGRCLMPYPPAAVRRRVDHCNPLRDFLNCVWRNGLGRHRYDREWGLNKLRS